MDFNELVKRTYREYFSALFTGGGEAAKGKLFMYMDKASTIKDAPTYAKLSDESVFLYDDFEWFVSSAHTEVMFGMLDDGSIGAMRVIKEWLVMAVTFNSRGK